MNNFVDALLNIYGHIYGNVREMMYLRKKQEVL